MKIKTTVLFIVSVVLLAQTSRAKAGDDQAWQARDEMHQSYELAPAASVYVSGINGPVEITTAAGASADVQIIRTARTQDDLLYRKVTVEATANSLTIRGDNNERGEARVRQHVILRLPSNVKLEVRGVNGPVTVGQIEGSVRVLGINGKVSVDGAAGYSNISGVNGQVSLTMSRLGEQGVHMDGINGSIEIRFPTAVDANLNVSGINGTVYSDLPNVTIQGKWGPREFKAQIGAGGPPISISGVNGRVSIHGS